jgi:hypothetical protein
VETTTISNIKWVTPKFTTIDACQAVQMLMNTNAHDVIDLQKKYFPKIHPDTIRNRLRAFGLKAYVCGKKPLLTNIQVARVGKSHAHWTVDDWKTVIFSDESKFNLVGSDGCLWCWRRQEKEFDSCFTKKVVKYGGGKIMVWGCLTAKGVGQICCIEGNMSGMLYTQILDSKFLRTLHDLKIKKKDIYFQQDNNLKHTLNLATEWFQKKKVDKLDWPPNSLDYKGSLGLFGLEGTLAITTPKEP